MEQDQALLESAIVLAVGAHRGRRDRGGAPYILQPLRVMLFLGDLREMMTGVLHDVVEDGDVTLDQLRRAGFPAEVVEAVDVLTRRPGEEYGDCLASVKVNPMALRVKLADLRDNLDKSRIAGPSPEDLRRWEEYPRVAEKLERRA